jgi:galactokinase
MSVRDRVVDTYKQTFSQFPALVVRAPGRVNLIGEHTDYNDGFVMPMAIEGAAYIALTPNDRNEVSVQSLDFGERQSFSLTDEFVKGEGWIEYIKGVAAMLNAEGRDLTGFDAAMGGDVPIGAGLSSSAALEVATARALAATSGIEWDPVAMAKLCQKAENEWVGMNCGIMDQMISATGRQDFAILIDCRSLQLDEAPLPVGTAVVILDTATRRGLVDSAYNERRSQCEAAAAHFGVAALRDVTLAEFESRAAELDEMTRRRARHVITENARTLKAAEAMRRGSVHELGKLMNESHESLKHDFEVTNDALNVMVECARAEEGCFGARMTGAGFGGCAVALVQESMAGKFATSVAASYQKATGNEPMVYVTQATDGAAVVES